MVDERKFPTIADLRDRLSELIDSELGHLPVQVLIVPESTMRAIARSKGHEDMRPPLMIELTPEGDFSRLPVSLISAEYLMREEANDG
jgi:hypothetical protein